MVNFNCTVPVAGASVHHADQQAPACRHIAANFALTVGKKGALVDRLTTPAGFAAEFGHRLKHLEGWFSSLVANAPQDARHMVTEVAFGEYLCSLAEALDLSHAQSTDQEPRTEANVLLITETHVMAVHLQRKVRQSQPYYAAKVYDPNNTAVYVRVEARTPDDLRTHDLRALMPTPRYADYYSPSPDGAESAPLSLMAISLEGTPRPTIGQGACLIWDPGTEPPRPTEFICMMRTGAALVLNQIAAALEHRGDSWDAAGVEALLGVKDAGGRPALNLAMNYGPSEVIRAFGRLLNAYRLPDEAKHRLLASTWDDLQITGLGAAIVVGRSDNVRAYGRVLAESELPEELLVDLLGRPVAGDPAIAAAVQQGRSGAIAFCDVINDITLPVAAKTMLLMAKYSDGTPALHHALVAGNADFVQTYLDAIRRVDLPKASRLELLCARNSAGRAGCAAAMDTLDLFHRNERAIAALVKGIGELGMDWRFVFGEFVREQR